VAERVFIGLGSNVGDHYGNCTRSIRAVVSDKRTRLSALSSLYYTSPLSSVPQPDILNGAFCIAWEDSATRLLALLQGIEERMGRVRTLRNGPRVIDLDILLFDQEVIRLPGLKIPHPRLHERRFALVPCMEIDPYLVHPVLFKGFDELLGSTEEGEVSWFCKIREEDVTVDWDEQTDPSDNLRMLRVP
jgi:2-amino-4-hydroxy-6-hydroxymethyldihydropteridine diphosphokinase